MEEVDKIIIQSLTSIGCNVKPDVTNIGQFDQDLIIESVATLLNLIQRSISPDAEQLPTKLPPSTAVKFRICTRFANICQSLGYKNELGYQTFLYSNEIESRKLLMFLVEKLNKETISSNDENLSGTATKTNKNLNALIAEKTKKLLNKFWIPPYLKSNGLRLDENKSYIKEGAKFESKLDASSIKVSNVTSKSKLQKYDQDYCQNYLKYITEQTIKSNLLASLIQLNTLNRINENSLINVDKKNDLGKNEKEQALNELKKSIKVYVDKVKEVAKEQNNLLTENDLAEIELDSKNLKLKNLFGKGSRFQHSEKLQFTTDDKGKNFTMATNDSEQKKEEEIANLKEKLEKFNENFESLSNEIDKVKNEQISDLEVKKQEQILNNKTLEEKIALKKKTVNLINDAPMNILKLKEEIKMHETKMNNLRKQWDDHKGSLKLRKEALEAEISDQKLRMQQKIDETKQLRTQINELNSDLSSKENFISELSKEMETLVKSESSKSSNRQFYTKRIMEICSNIDRQRKEIDKILIETKSIQKDLNQMTGKLERIFNTTDEVIFKDAKQSETNKIVYKLFISINTEYDKLLDDLEQTSQLDRECRDLEDQVNLESQNKIGDNIQKVMNDLKQIKQENEELLGKLKSKQ
ncbi:unnamed protein product [Brachionus calyciflorus]|uniref:Coiled-coil domain-containing protein 22 homolog n=1 Tax=Brachionus calyciflorus TaxID=104777 RepID=A0A814EQR1_9BILA|nr:unnamed protein product [Brachionus calyciflorus]